jgi:thiol-disulfide isomerase/thioredoxin
LKKITLWSFILLLSACGQTEDNKQENEQVIAAPKSTDITGLWRGVLASPGGELPFGIDISKEGGTFTAKILNGSERVDTSSVELNDNILTINFEWFDARLKAQLNEEGDSMNGSWSKTAEGKDQKSQLPFSAERGYQYRFKQEIDNSTTTPVTGNWETIFNDEDGESLGIGEFKQQGQIVSGTFLTPTGDYRFLSGVTNNNTLHLSAFDGAHAFLFDAEIEGDKLVNGNFWSRESYHATWQANKSDDTSGFLPSSWEMNKATDKASFAFEDVDGHLIQLSDERFKNKPVLINLFGTWCPNCNDEAPVLAEFYDTYNVQGLEIIGLAFEFTEDIQRDKKQITAFKKRHKINYPILLAGGNNKEEATKILGFIDKIKSYPTTVFLDRDHNVVKINTGFSGPGTGDHYTQLVGELESEIMALLN